MLKVILSHNAGDLSIVIGSTTTKEIVTCWLLGQPGAAQYHPPLAEIASTAHRQPQTNLIFLS